MSLRSIEFQLEPVWDMSNCIKKGKLITTSLGPGNEICGLIIDNKPDYRDANGLAVFAKIQPYKDNSYKIIKNVNSFIDEKVIRDIKWNFHFVQSLSDDRTLLVCSRSRYYRKDEFDMNAKVFSKEGALSDEFLLGDGIQDLKVTLDDNIWTSYFDEGVFGNYGWDEPIGACGLRSWDIKGNPLFSYKAPDSDKFICDCYAMNPISANEVWFYFYTEFNLAHYKNGKLDFWETDMSGSDGFITKYNYFLFRGGYQNRDSYYLYELSAYSNSLIRIAEVKLFDEVGEVLKSDWIDCRDSRMLIQKGTKVYLLEFEELL